MLGKLGTDSHINKSFSKVCSAVFVQRVPYFEWMLLDMYEIGSKYLLNLAKQQNIQFDIYKIRWRK